MSQNKRHELPPPASRISEGTGSTRFVILRWLLILQPSDLYFQPILLTGSRPVNLAAGEARVESRGNMMSTRHRGN